MIKMNTGKMTFKGIGYAMCLLAMGCSDKQSEYDASGMFEVEEVVVSSEISGRLVKFDVEEGAQLKAG